MFEPKSFFIGFATGVGLVFVAHVVLNLLLVLKIIS